MLSQTTIDTVKSTAPLLEEHGLTITQNFYQRLFAENPDLQHIFNGANQRKETQSRALADAVFAYAQNIDNLEALLPVVERIANKHASLGVAAEHYPVVGRNLLAAIADVLDLPQDHQALSAWQEAYQLLANIFIDAEQAIYSSNETREGGWQGFRAFVITDIVAETPEVKSFYLKPEDDQPILSYQAGQYLGVKTRPAASEFDEIRQYSLSDAAATDYYRITVKCEAHGLASNHLHDSQVGDQLLCRPPAGVFTCNNTLQPLVLIAGGVGITPIFAMLKENLQNGVEGENILFINCARNKDLLIFDAELAKLSAEYGFTYKACLESGDEGDYTGFLNEQVLDRWMADKSANVYFCGPLPFMKAINSALLNTGFEADQLNYEVFGPSAALS